MVNVKIENIDYLRVFDIKPDFKLVTQVADLFAIPDRPWHSLDGKHPLPSIVVRLPKLAEPAGVNHLEKTIGTETILDHDSSPSSE